MSTSLDPIFLSVCYTIICSLEHWLLPRTHFAEEEEEEEEEEGKKRDECCCFPAMIPWLHALQIGLPPGGFESSCECFRS
jgi:hypothetical protein